MLPSVKPLALIVPSAAPSMLNVITPFEPESVTVTSLSPCVIVFAAPERLSSTYFFVAASWLAVGSTTFTILFEPASIVLEASKVIPAAVKLPLISTVLNVLVPVLTVTLPATSQSLYLQ